MIGLWIGTGSKEDLRDTEVIRARLKVLLRICWLRNIEKPSLAQNLQPCIMFVS